MTRPLAFNPAAASPGEVVQLFLQANEEAVIEGVALDRDCVAKTAIFGNERVDLEQSPQGLKGKTLRPGLFFTLLAQFNGKEPGIVSGQVLVAGEGKAVTAPPQASAAAQSRMAELKAQSAQRAGQPVAPSWSGKAPNPATAPLTHKPEGIRPGVNEVAILMQRSECELLIAVVKGQRPVHAHEQPGILRALESALTRG